MRSHRPGSIQSAVQDAYRAAGGLEAVSADIGLAVPTLSHGTSVDETRPGGLGINHLDRLGRIVPGAAEPIARHFARLAGGIFQPLDLGGATETSVYALTQEFSDVLHEHAEAHSAGSKDPTDYTPAEAAKAIRELDDLIRVAAQFRGVLAAKARG